MNRPVLLSALARFDRGDADALIAIRLDRISRSVADFAGLLDRAGRKGWGLLLLSPALDLAGPAGRFTANVVASAAQYERELISARTREGPVAVTTAIVAASAPGRATVIVRRLHQAGLLWPSFKPRALYSLKKLGAARPRLGG